jgi:Fur family ferric uptake transcriptional regulator
MPAPDFRRSAVARDIIRQLTASVRPPSFCAATFEPTRPSLGRVLQHGRNAFTRLSCGCHREGARVDIQRIETRRKIVTATKKTDIEAQCAAKGMRMTEQRRVIARVLGASEDHPDVEELYRRCAEVDDRISLSTVYRTVRLFEDAGIIERHDFRDGRARYEQSPDTHHDHLINLRTGEVIEFSSEEIEELQAKVARRLGYRLVDHRLELYAVPLDEKPKN